MDFNPAGVVGGAHHHASVLGTVSEAARLDWNDLSCGVTRNLTGRCRLPLYRLAIATLRGLDRKPFAWKRALTNRQSYQTAALTVAAGLLLGLVSWGLDGEFGLVPLSLELPRV